MRTRKEQAKTLPNNYRAHNLCEIRFFIFCQARSFCFRKNKGERKTIRRDGKFGNIVNIGKCEWNFYSADTIRSFMNNFLILIQRFLCSFIFGETCMRKQRFADERREVERCRTSWKIFIAKSWSSNHPQILFPVLFPHCVCLSFVVARLSRNHFSLD